MNLHFVKEFLETKADWWEDTQYLKDMELSALFGPIHGDFHRGNIVRYEGKSCLIDFDTFEQSGIHHFDFLNQFWIAENLFSKSWFDYLEELVRRWDELESHEYWNDIPTIDKKNILYLFVIYSLNKMTRGHKSVESESRYKNILKNIRNLPA